MTENIVEVILHKTRYKKPIEICVVVYRTGLQDDIRNDKFLVADYISVTYYIKAKHFIPSDRYINNVIADDIKLLRRKNRNVVLFGNTGV